MMKKITSALLLAAMLITSLAACGKPGNTSNDTTTTTPNIQVTGEPTAEVTTVAETENPYDENGYLITKDDDHTDYCICTWTPKWTGKFIIRIVNRGSVYNAYTLRTN